MENKVLNFRIEDGFILIDVDPNKDGTAVISLRINLAEIPDEVLAVIKK